MSPLRSRYVTACQQLLALAVVLAVLTPAAGLISLDVVRRPPAGVGADRAAVGAAPAGSELAAYARVAGKASRLPAEPVDPVVTEHQLTAPAAAGPRAARRAARPAASVVGEPQDVSGYGAIGVTWAHGEEVPDDELVVEARTLTDGTWSEWTELEYHDDHGPDPDSAEARRARPGTDPLLVGEVDQVQVRAMDVAGALPGDMRLAVIAPGEADDTVTERPAIDTATMEETGAGDLQLAAAGQVTPKPQIFSRAQWGADESMRSGSPGYYEVHAGFVHHTVNANDYTREQVPGILRSIYAYHTRSRGWSDVGYNYLVDKFGRIWEGRAGGVDRPVVGAHTLGYNEYSFAMSAIGNFETAQPAQVVVEAYGALFAWKLSLHGVDAASSRQAVGSRSFPAINGHRDAGSTACPGKNLYARLGDIRRLAAAAQVGWEGRDLDADLVGTPHPDLVARRASDGRLVLLPTGGLTSLAKPATTGAGWSGYADVLAAADLTGDGRVDAVGVAPDGAVAVHPATGQGAAFGPALRTATGTRGHDLLAAVGDLDGDGRGDLVGRETATGAARAFLGRGDGRFALAELGTSWAAYDLVSGVGDLDEDGAPDLVARDRTGALHLLPGVPGTASLGTPRPLLSGGPRYDVVTGGADWDLDGHLDLLVRRAGGHAWVLPGRGDGTVGAARGPVKRLKGRADVSAAGDLDGDGTPDVLARRGDALLVLAGAGTYETTAPVETGIRARRLDLVLNAGDWDGDGHGDLVVRRKKDGALLLRRGDGQGGFGRAVKLGTGFGGVQLLEVVGDMTGDGWPDLLGQPAGQGMRLYPGRGAAPLGPSYVAHSAVTGLRQVGVGRWDADGAPDTLVRRGDQALVWSGNGPGGLTRATTLAVDLGSYDQVTAVPDVRLGAGTDLVVRQRGTGLLLLLERKGTGFAAPRVLDDGAEVYDLVD